MKYCISLTATSVLLALSNVSAGTLLVCPGSTNPVPPFANWATAATNIQQAVNAAAPGNEVVVTNGIYGAVNVDKPLLLRSVNGPQVTIIDAARLGRCAWLTNGTSLAGFWLRHGVADVYGGGVFCASSDVFLTNCVITENTVFTNDNGSAVGSGGGVYGGTLYNCLVATNSAAISGGGATASTLYNCTVTGNRANRRGGGVYSSAATNCVVYSNTAVLPYNDYDLAQFDHSCTEPMPTNGVGNITNAPQFVNYAGGDLRQKGVSPCIDAGDNRNVFTSVDLAGHPRIMRGTVDMGAYEFQGTNAIVFYAWVQHHGIVIDGTTDYDDPDGDGMNNWQEWVCFTCPTNPLMYLHLISAVPVGANVVVRWKSSGGVKYLLERGTNLTSPFMLVASNLLGQSSEFVYTDTNVPRVEPLFYRVGVRPPPPTPGPIVWAPALRAQATRPSANP
jgi:parallel beta-helix repeat protein